MSSGDLIRVRHRHTTSCFKIAGMIEMAGLQIDAGGLDIGNGGLGQDFGGDIIDRGVGDFMNEADIFVFA
jgi:hypothetical protein